MIHFMKTTDAELDDQSEVSILYLRMKLHHNDPQKI